MKSLVKKVVALLVMLMITTIVPVANTSAMAKPKLNKKSATIYVGKTVSLKLKNNKKKVKWTTSNKKIATVTSKGKVKGKKAGKVIITAKVANKKYTCRVTVKKIKKAEKHSWDNVQVIIPETIGDDDDRNQRVQILEYSFGDDGSYYEMYIKLKYVHTSKFYDYFGHDVFGTYFYCYDKRGKIIDSCFLYIGEAYLGDIYYDDAMIPSNTAKIVFVEYPMI